MLWLWITLIGLGALCFCGLVFVIEKRKKIFKKRSKVQRAEKKKAKLAEKQPPQTLPEKPKDDVSLNEDVVEVLSEDGVHEEVYTPSSEFVEEVVYPVVSRQRPIRRDPNAFANFKREYFPIEEKVPIKQQIKELSPEIKALLFAGVLDRKPDDQF